MGKLIIIMRPQALAQIIDFGSGEDGGDDVQLHDLCRLIGCDTVDRAPLTMQFDGPDGSKRGADIWFDDEALLNDATPANRRAPSGTIISGTILCAIFDRNGNTKAMTDAEAAAVLGEVSGWELLPEGTQKPEPGFTFIVGEGHY